MFWQRGPELAVEPGDLTDDVLGRARLLLVGSDDVPAMISAAGRARGQDVRTVGDLERIHSGTDALLRELDVVIMAASFPEAFTGISPLGAAVQAVAEHSGAALTCVTLGEEGCLAVGRGPGDSRSRIPDSARRHDGRRGSVPRGLHCALAAGAGGAGR